MREFLLSMAMMLLPLLGAGCTDEPQQAGQTAAFQSTKVAAAAPAALAAAHGDDPVECKDVVSTGMMVHKKICYAARQRAEWQAERPHAEAVTQFENFGLH
jgi:hypothetical protein